MKSNRLAITSLAALLAALVGFQSGVAHADGPIAVAPIDAAPVEFAAPTPPEANLFDTVIDAEVMADLEALTERIEQYAYVDENGLVQLGDVTAEELQVTERFLSDLRAAYDHSNQLIERGEFVVADDFTVEQGENFASMAEHAVVDPVMPGINAAGGEFTVEGDVPDWNAYGYSSGAMFYNAYSTYYRYYSSYWNLCNTMSAYIRMPHISRNLQYFYAYNSNYLRNNCYQNSGLWYYLPYQSNCRYNSNPCYGNSISYRPAYYWTRSYTYNQSCRCYQNNWLWQGYYSRY